MDGMQILTILIIVIFAIPFFLVCRLLWRLGNKKR